MQFVTAPQAATPKNLYPCLATITVTPHGAEHKARRRSSGGSFSAAAAEALEGNALARVLSGGRRKSVATEAAAAAAPAEQQDDETGTWYWRVQAGTVDGHLVLLPLTQPPNPLLTSRPVPLSQAMPAHSAAARADRSEEGIAAKIKHLFNKGSRADHAATTTTTTTNTADVATTDVATTPEAKAETAWPGVIQGEHLAAIVVDLRSVDKDKVIIGENKKEGSTVTVPISASVIFSLLEPVGSNGSAHSRKSGQIRFEFDKDWIGAKGEAELLHNSILTEIENGAAARVPRQNEQFQLGQSNGANTVPLVKEVAPHQLA